MSSRFLLTSFTPVYGKNKYRNYLQSGAIVGEVYNISLIKVPKRKLRNTAERHEMLIYQRSVSFLLTIDLSLLKHLQLKHR